MVTAAMCEAVTKDLYAVLGAEPSDSVQQLKHRYQRLALQVNTLPIVSYESLVSETELITSMLDCCFSTVPPGPSRRWGLYRGRNWCEKIPGGWGSLEDPEWHRHQEELWPAEKRWGFYWRGPDLISWTCFGNFKCHIFYFITWMTDLNMSGPKSRCLLYLTVI